MKSCICCDTFASRLFCVLLVILQIQEKLYSVRNVHNTNLPKLRERIYHINFECDTETQQETVINLSTIWRQAERVLGNYPEGYLAAPELDPYKVKNLETP